MIAVSLGLLACGLAGGLLWRRRCLSLVAQASHELRGPLQAALLGLHGIEAPGAGARLAAIELELRRRSDHQHGAGRHSKFERERHYSGRWRR